jgi:hypothetical protein
VPFERTINRKDYKSGGICVSKTEEFFETRAAVARDFTFDGMRFLRTVQCADGEVLLCINRKMPSKCDLQQLL